MNRHVAIEKWLFWRVLKCALGAALLLGAALTSGVALLDRIRPGVALRERLVLGLGVGLHAFFVLQTGGGLLGLFGSRWAAALPLALLVGGTWSSLPLWRRVWRKRRRFSFTFGVTRAWHVPLAVVGLFWLALLYLSILSPDNAAFDSRWYHLGLGEGWAAVGGITRTPEAWFVDALPNFAAILYSWGFQAKGFDLFDAVVFAGQLEFFLFIATLCSMPVLVRWLVPKAPASITWVAVFLFPSVFIYDAGLHSGNDHIAAFWGIPIFLALRRAFRSMHWRDGVLVALFASAALLTKYQAASLVLGPALALLGRAGWLVARRRSGAHAAARSLRFLGVALAASVAFMAPLWLRNWAWYGDPLYPALHKHITPTTWSPGLSELMQINWKVMVHRPEGPLADQLGETLARGVDFSFKSFARHGFHGKMPYFGSLFTLSALWLPLMKGSRRTVLLWASAQLGVFVWFFLSHVERYLQVLVPQMAVVVACSVWLAWQQGYFTRVPVMLLVAAQAVWGGDAIFLPSHAMNRDLPMVQSAHLLQTSFRGTERSRDAWGGAFRRIGDALPRGSKILLHDYNGRLGLKHEVIVDKPRYQGLIRYGEMKPADIQALYQSLGITHVVSRYTSTNYDTVAGDLRYFDYAHHALMPAGKKFGDTFLAPFPATIGADDANDTVLYAGCGKTFVPGLFHVSMMNVQDDSVAGVRPIEPLARSKEQRLAQLARARFLVMGKRCRAGLSDHPDGMERIATRSTEELWARPW